jgi:hypothetical protein
MAVYFAYGSNMRSARLTERIGPSQAIGAVHVCDWTLRFDKPGRDGTGKANLVPATGLRAWGVAYQVADSAWELLDRFEPGYRREGFRLDRSDGTSLECIAYLYPSLYPSTDAPREQAPWLAPSGEYLGHLVDGALEHGLPTDWIETIRAAARAG